MYNRIYSIWIKFIIIIAIILFILFLTGKGCNNGTETTGKAGEEEREIPQHFYAYEMLP